eukprot:NODE_13111_length_1184_cov_5.638600.p2 GENE.NODE_13111_length_1184_cov_5.638600~~NODE_13111_length_1184_cov_5.638600.p2  ORF type:complete len:241 (+),score=86.87 NODE_13111_length_1184_cov_5.638600:92-814(+)
MAAPPTMTWEKMREHMADDHRDTILAYAIVYGGVVGAQRASLKGMDGNGMLLAVELADGSMQDVGVPYECGIIEDVREGHKVVISMSKHARQLAFVSFGAGVAEERRVALATFGSLNSEFQKACQAGDWATVTGFYCDDAVLVPQARGPPEGNAPILAGREAIARFLLGNGAALLTETPAPEAGPKGIRMHTMRVQQTSNFDVTEIGVAWGKPTGRPYCRQWRYVEEAWRIAHDCLPVNV